ncbi:MAG TPA: carbohydrate-binding family 9-like protein [Mucilaginibacter sp.]|nr:carbohydrate-binding family 9-like protein [Mucilaginibacter sp.]
MGSFSVVYRFRFLLIAFIFLPAYLSAQPGIMNFENLLTTPKGYIAHHINTAPVIDGNLDDVEWQHATWTDDFTDIESSSKPAPPLKTNFKILWDDSCLYVAARIEEPNLWATLTHRDNVVFLDNDVELFINPNGTTHQYFEIECNALNTIFDLFLNKPYRNGGRPMSSWNTPGMRTAVKLQGTLNDPSDTDKGWTLEMAIPFKALSLGNRTQVPKEGTIWRVNFSRVEWDTKVTHGTYEKLKDDKGQNLPEHNWVWSPQGLINMHYPERWGYVSFTKKDDTVRAFIPSYSETQKRFLWLLYYRQMAWQKNHGRYAVSLKELGMNGNVTAEGKQNVLSLEATPHQFMAFIRLKNDHIVYSINQEGLIDAEEILN